MRIKISTHIRGNVTLGNTVEIFKFKVLLSFPYYLFTTSIASIKIAYSSRLNGPKQDVPENKSNFRLK
jgi:hypothetical protein